MTTKKNIFIQIDEFIFQKLDLLKSDGGVQKINDALSGLEEEQQKMVVQISTFLIILIPFIFVTILWIGNSKYRKSVQIKNQILDQISLLNGNRDALNSVSSNYISPYPITGQQELESKIHDVMSSHKIEFNKVQVIGFNQLSASSTISKIEATIRFREFGTQDFANFMRALTENERFKISRVNLLKNSSTSLLQGELLLLHMGKMSSINQ